MCFYQDIFGNGDILSIQLLIIISSLLIIPIIRLSFLKGNHTLSALLCLLIIFETLDLVLTARGILDGHGESIPFSNLFLSFFGSYYGIIILNIFWIIIISALCLIYLFFDKPFINAHLSRIPSCIRPTTHQYYFILKWVLIAFILIHIVGFMSWFIVPVVGGNFCKIMWSIQNISH